jgi:hypothetical protein
MRSGMRSATPVTTIPGVAVPDEHQVVEVLELDQVHHVAYVGVEVDLGAGQVRPLAQTGERDGVGVVAVVAELAGHGLPRPAAEPGAWNQDEGRHRIVPFWDGSSWLARSAAMVASNADGSSPH